MDDDDSEDELALFGTARAYLQEPRHIRMLIEAVEGAQETLLDTTDPRVLEFWLHAEPFLAAVRGERELSDREVRMHGAALIRILKLPIVLTSLDAPWH